MGVKLTELADLIACTINDLPKQEFEVGWDNQDYEWCRIYQSERMEVDGGTQIERKVMLDHSGNARYRRMYDTDEPAVGDVISTIKVPWTLIGTNYSLSGMALNSPRPLELGEFIDLRFKIKDLAGLSQLRNVLKYIIDLWGDN